MSGFEIRPALPGQEAIVLDFIRGIAEYERLAHKVVATAEDIRLALFGPRPAAEAIIAWRGEEPLGFALFHANFSTFTGRAGIHLEDLFVWPTHRGQGIGKALFDQVALLARQRGAPRMDWVVLDWNKPAIEFYRAAGAIGLDDWRLFRLEFPGLDAPQAPEE